MILLQNLFCLVQIDRHHFFRLPRQARHKIKIVIKHSVLMTVFALLFHPVQNLFCFSFCFLIHTGFRNFRLKTAYIWNIFRMHFIKLFLQKLDLLLQGRFPVKLAVWVLLRRLRLLTYLINGNQLILFFPRNAQITGKRTGNLIKILPAQDHCARPHTPVKIFGEIEQFFPDPRKVFLFFLFIQIIDIRQNAGFCRNRFFCHFNIRKRDPCLCRNPNRPFLINRFYLCRHSNRIKIFRHQILSILFLFQNQKQNVLPDILWGNLSYRKHIFLEIKGNSGQYK